MPSFGSSGAGLKPVQQMIDFAQPKPASLREAEDSYSVDRIGFVSALAANPRSSWQEPNSFPIADRGRVHAGLRFEFANRHESLLT